jgi:endonuclease/exonuclease/phosphatase (EEP) superfamily protein YafD
MLCGLATMAALAGCAHQAERGYDPVVSLPGAPQIATVAHACAANLGRAAGSDYVELDSSDLEILNWNIQKGADPAWTADLQGLSDEPDLMLFQEAALQTDDWDALASGLHPSFAPGYRTRRALTGVMTISAVQPLTQCKLVSFEPWLGSPKATMITEYGLTGTDETLLVVNIHAVNFTFGVRHFQEQVRQAESVVKGHPGPVLFSGDFNTWRAGRAEVVREVTASLGLKKLTFAEDHRKRIFGHPVDHIYVRGFEVLSATTYMVQSSDHNPMFVQLRL